jgi:outer membrane lipoprotein-sorting protein
MRRHRAEPVPTKALRRVLLAGAGVLLLIGGAASAAAAAFDLAQLTQLLASKRSGEATFVEKREVSVLDRTVMTSGRLSFEAPDTFVRENLKPQRERVAVVGNMLTMSRGDRTRSVALDSLPEASVIIEAIRGTLTGNRGALEKVFETSVSGNAERWSLELVPRDARLRTQVATVRVSGRQAEVREMLVVMPDGDRSTMTIEPVVGKAAMPAAAGSGAAR